MYGLLASGYTNHIIICHWSKPQLIGVEGVRTSQPAMAEECFVHSRSYWVLCIQVQLFLRVLDSFNIAEVSERATNKDARTHTRGVPVCNHMSRSSALAHVA